MSSFGKRIRTLRKSNKLTQKQLAEKLNLAESTIGMYERDERQPSFTITNNLADFFGVEVDFLLGRNEDQQEANPIEVMGKTVSLSNEEYKVFQEILKSPALFNDLKSDPEKKVKQLIKLWKFQKSLEEDDDEEDIVDDF